jgi:hypothetical protein
MAFRLRPLHIAFQASILCGVLAIAATSTLGQTGRTKLFEQEDVVSPFPPRV